MGTPGDKKELKKTDPETSVTIISSESDSELELPLLAPSEVSSVLQETAIGTSEEMGVITHLPVPFSSTSLPPLSNKPEVFQQQNLEQATLEDYYGQSKYYETLYPLGQQQSTATFQTVSEPGPSGLQTFKSKPASQPKKKKPDQKKSHMCPQCHKTFSTGEKLHRHYRSHQEARESSPYKCDQCKKTFTSRFKLVRHALIHSDRKPFSCSVCERTFHRKDHLKNHIKVHSPTKKLYECGSCKKQYTSLLSFRKHQAVHAAEEGNLTCQICSEVFENKEQILYHLKVHAGSRTVKNPSEKKYHCDYCDRRFFTKKDVKRHLVVHTGMRDFLCQFCPQRFGRKDHLVRHIKKSHNKDYTEQSSQISESSIATQPHRTRKPETITSGALSVFKDDSSDDLFEEIPPETPRVKEEPQELKSESDLEGVKTIFEEENVSPLEEEDIYLSEQTTQCELKGLLVTDIFKKIEKSPVKSVPISSEPTPTTTIRHLPQKSLASTVRSSEIASPTPQLQSLLRHVPQELSSSLAPSFSLQYSGSSFPHTSEVVSPPSAEVLFQHSPGEQELLERPLLFPESLPSTSRRQARVQRLPPLIPFRNPPSSIPPIRLKSAQKLLPSRVQMPEQPVEVIPELSLPLPPLRLRPASVRPTPTTIQATQQQEQEEEEEEEKKPLPGFSQTFQPPPPS